MSRVGKEPIAIPDGVEIEIQERTVKVKGSKGELSRVFPSGVKITKTDNQLEVKRATDAAEHRALHGLTRTLLSNMVVGVSSGFEKQLEIIGVGYRATKKGSDLELQVGYSKPVLMTKEEGVEIEIPAPNKVIVKGADKEKVGEFAAKVRAVRKPEPYKGKGIRYVGEYVRRKVGKTAK